jgi:cytochrome bd-type quinol oxidase subunit 2
MSTVSRSLTSWMCRPPRWAFPVFCLALGLVLAGAMALGGDAEAWWWVVGVFVVYGGLLYALSPRSEVASLLSGDARDERQRSINEKASAASFSVLVVVFVVGFLVTTATGSDLAVAFSTLSAFAGLTWVTALVVLTRRG